MAFNVFEDDAIMAEFDRISAEPIDDEPYSLVKNPVPVVESILDFNGHKIDTGSWCSGEGVDENKKKVGKAKTASDPKLAKAAPKVAPKSVNEKKEDGKIVENDTVADKKKKDQIVEVNADAEVKAKTPADAGKGGSFDKVAKSAASSNQSGAEKNKKFTESAKLQKHIDLFKKGVRALATDSKTSKDAEKFLKKFDEISSYLKPRMEGVDANSGAQPIDPQVQSKIDTAVDQYVRYWMAHPHSRIGSRPDYQSAVHFVDRVMGDEQVTDSAALIQAVKKSLEKRMSKGDVFANPQTESVDANSGAQPIDPQIQSKIDAAVDQYVRYWMAHPHSRTGSQPDYQSAVHFVDRAIGGEQVTDSAAFIQAVKKSLEKRISKGDVFA